MLPLETWHIILRYSISLPDFFDTHITDRIPPWFIYESNWNDTEQYWDAERTRNNLRRVCSSWDIFLRNFAHRFVSMDDVVHRILPADHLQSAIRQFLESFPSLRHAFTGCYWIPQTFNSLKSSTLTTLTTSFTMPNPSSWALM
ncbi:hypothetical protein CPB86DRAFT_213195 [Serendipita vermifera]|nr:hypothetical protein CPB86DRAFT_213195 [Serendipita vermifera]